MNMNWFRWYHGTVSDPKLALIAKKSGQTRPVVIAIWAALLEHASQAESRGDISDFDAETVAVALDLDEDAIPAVIAAMTTKEMIVDGVITAWGKRQPQREDDASTARVRAYRERLKQTETACNAVKRSETHGNAQIREEEIREEEIREEAQSAARAPETLAPLAEPPPAEPEPKARSKPSKAAKPDKPAKAPIDPHWQPAETTYGILDKLGIDRRFAQACIPEFVLYWQERGESRTGWEASFVNSVKHSWEKRPAVPGGGRVPPTARFDAHAKHARLVAANQAAVAEWLAQEDSANPWGITVLQPPELTHATH